MKAQLNSMHWDWATQRYLKDNVRGRMFICPAYQYEAPAADL